MFFFELILAWWILSNKRVSFCIFWIRFFLDFWRFKHPGNATAPSYQYASKTPVFFTANAENTGKWVPFWVCELKMFQNGLRETKD